jgi:hypothetical protein
MDVISKAEIKEVATMLAYLIPAYLIGFVTGLAIGAGYIHGG